MKTSTPTNKVSAPNSVRMRLDGTLPCTHGRHNMSGRVTRRHGEVHTGPGGMPPGHVTCNKSQVTSHKSQVTDLDRPDRRQNPARLSADTDGPSLAPLPPPSPRPAASGAPAAHPCPLSKPGLASATPEVHPLPPPDGPCPGVPGAWQRPSSQCQPGLRRSRAATDSPSLGVVCPPPLPPRPRDDGTARPPPAEPRKAVPCACQQCCWHAVQCWVPGFCMARKNSEVLFGWMGSGQCVDCTSGANTFSPPLLIISLALPTSHSTPRPSMYPRSPVRNQPWEVRTAAVVSGRPQYPLMMWGPRVSTSPTLHRRPQGEATAWPK